MRDFRWCFLFLLMIAFAVLVNSSYAVRTSIWSQGDQQAFESGKLEGVSISVKGWAQLSPELKQIADLKESYVWDLVQGTDGHLYVATGNEGRIYKVAPDGTGADKPFVDTPEIDVRSLAISPDGSLYAGTAPDGLVYKITPDGNFVPVLVSKQKYVWDIVLDDAGNLYAGTGPEGKIFKLTPSGEESEIFDSEESHIMCLLYQDGALYAGTEGTGIVYKIVDGKASAVYHTRQKEVHNILFDATGNLYIATTTGEAAQKAPSPNSSGPPPGSAPPQEPKARIYMVNPDGIPFQVWQSPERLILALAVRPSGNLIVGTGDNGKIYEVAPNGEGMYLGKTDESQLLAFHQDDAGSLFVGTGNSGKLYQLMPQFISEATVESTVKDAGVISTWGKISWDAETPLADSIKLVTRTGMTEKPDKTWSDWSDTHTSGEGTLITSPSARYIQWKATLSTSDSTQTPALKRVNVAYVQKNIEPDLGEIKVTIGEGKGRENQPPDRTKRTVQWQARDRNNDKLEYTLYYKQTDETTWKLLKEELSDTKYSWDATALPDGEYEIRVVATDKWSNPEGTELSYGHASKPFEVDNTQPVLSEPSASAEGPGRFRIACEAQDQTSRIANAAYSIDGGKWRVVFSADGVFDSQSESFSFLTPELESGQHTLVIKVDDAAGNQQTARIVFGE